MVSIEGVDYSYARPSASALKAADKKFAVRYITKAGAGNKDISKTEYDELHSAGVAVVVVYEQNAGAMKNGYSQGVADAKDAQAQLRAIVGLDDHLPVYFAADWDAAPSDQGVINGYLDGAGSVLGYNRTGIYGSYYVCKRVQAAKKARWLWQTYAWSGGNVLAGIHLYQYKNGVKLGTGTVDLCRALQVEYGQHGVQPPAPVVKPAPAIVTAPVPPPAVVAATANANFDPAGFKGTYYFKGTAASDVFVYNAVLGTKRHVSAAEWAIVRGYGHDIIYTIPQADADKVPTAS